MEDIITLNLGGFPKDVLDFQESSIYLQQLLFIDYQLQLLIQNEFSGKQFVSAGHFELQGVSQPREKLLQLINYVTNVNGTYSEEYKTVVEKFYFNIIMAHLFYLNSQLDEMAYQLDLIHASALTPSTSQPYNEFIEFLICRYHVVGSYASNSSSKLIDYLVWYRKPFKKSQITANNWLDLLYLRLTTLLTHDGTGKLSFHDIQSLNFARNSIAVIGYANYLVKTSVLSLSSNHIVDSFKSEYSAYLTSSINLKIANKLEFPKSDESSKTPSQLNDFIYNLYETLNQVPFNYTIIKPSLTKKFLINSTLKTYQSQTVLINLIKVLGELEEYDEALAAFKTLRDYIEADLKQHEGNFDDILQIIDIYSTCLIKFNPLNTNRTKGFKYTSEDKVLVLLDEYAKELLIYLDVVRDSVGLTYDETHDTESFKGGQKVEPSSGLLSFLFKKYNVNILLSDHSHFIELVSQAWFSLGYYHYYLTINKSSTYPLLEAHKMKVIKYYKNSLIVNSTGNPEYLFNYALSLSFDGHLKEALKLCKFILKKYPESFKTWNLMVLLLTSFEANDPDFVKSDKQNASNGYSNGTHEAIGTLNGNGASNGKISESQAPLKESEKFINNALNIAGLFIAKHHQRDVKLTTEAKYEILQLKLTQLAVWESIYGVQYILEFLSEVFMLFHELFTVDHTQPKEPTRTLIPVAHDSKWSHRPSFIDPKIEPPHANGSSKPKDLTRRLSRMGKPNAVDTVEGLKNLSLNHNNRSSLTHHATTESLAQKATTTEKKILQDLWLWTSKIYLKIGMLEESEQCIVEAESIYEPNVKTFTMLGYLTSKSRKFLSLQELERSIEKLNKDPHNKIDYGNTLLGLCKLFIIDDEAERSLFISSKDRDAGIIRLKNCLEAYSLSWPYGANNLEVWYYLSKIYEIIDDKTLLTKSLWKCVELEDFRPVRGYEIADSFKY
ncbi:uncharacterized protein CANTADRAFT_55221 [Suhomyces tanzawaensis NRRL Y-17324]|uniref:Cargo-transport protein YPP1 n=1 Tax=Suhomyces tanzawaensis NRRL Y-17324 TaxID=984487 RepID=A0A1E4SE36_9ASCO|nr:uncharacterized protein CANTADRAFT_55221 [Suhomyces tanzawaensis NRRL Y-17324]ODV77748.1 hypothetical protein CANTADRAFT_55221 [Suhomyces tanzawaensis NRRL Y-17324]